MADDRLAFETRLADVFERYADLAPVEVDPMAMAHAAASGSGRRSWSSLARLPIPGVDGRAWTRVLVPLGLLGLLLAALGAAWWVGGQQQDRNLLVDRGPTLPEAFIDAEIVPFDAVESVLGPLVWTTVEGGVAGPRPNPEPIYGSLRTGYLYGDHDTGIWASDDGLNWRRVSTDFTTLSHERGFDTVDGRWALTSGSNVLQRTNDGWSPLDLPSLSQLPVQSGDVTLIPGVLSATDAFISDNGAGFEQIQMPYALASLMTAPDGGFIAFPDGASGGLIVSSRDGRTWSEHRAPRFMSGEPAQVEVGRQVDRLLALVEAADGRHTVWSSTDGVDWRLATPSIRYPDAIANIEIKDFGLLAGGDFVSVDLGRSWARIPSRDPEDVCGSGGGVGVGGTTSDTFYLHAGSGGKRCMSVGRFQGFPERVPSPTSTPPVSAAVGLAYTGVTAPARSAEAGGTVEPINGPTRVETSAGPLEWTGYDTGSPLRLFALRDGGYVLSPLTHHVVTWYSPDGEVWSDWSGKKSFYAEYTVRWDVGGWATTTKSFTEPGDGPDELWRYDDGVFHEVELPAWVDGVQMPVDSAGTRLILGSGSETTHDWIILEGADGVVKQYESPWTIPDWVIGWDGVGHEVTIAALDGGGYVAINSNIASEGQGPPHPKDTMLVETSGLWMTSDGLTWTRADEPPFSSARILAIESMGTTIRVDTDGFDWVYLEGSGWARAEPRLLPTGGTWQRGYKPLAFSSSIDIEAGRVATYGTTYADPDGTDPYWFSPDAGASWASFPGPPWVTQNEYRGMRGSYVVTPDFLFAEDGQEWWIGRRPE
jgi:hypothetical protein